MHRSKKYLSWGLSLGVIPIGIVLLNSNPASALIKPTAELTIVDGYSDNVTAELGVSTYNPVATSEFYIPFKIHVEDTSSWDVKVMTEDGNIDLLGQKNGATLYSITSDAAISSDTMTNHWGYKYATGSTIADTATALDGKVYSKAPDTLTSVASGTPRGEETKYLALGFGAKVNGNQTADTYKGKIMLYLTAEPDEITLFDMAERNMTMQDMHSDYCKDTPTPSKTATEPATTLAAAIAGGYDGEGRINKVPEVALKDSRNDRTYKIAKLADGECWMVQNLALDSGTTEATRRVITDADSDITKENLPASLSNMNEAGKYKMPKSSLTGFSGTDVGAMYNGSYQPNAYTTQGYSENQAKGAANCASTNPADCKGANSGSYYSFKAATAGSATSTADYYDAPASICPKGWRLPTGSNRASDNSQFVVLANTYKADYSVFQSVWHDGTSATTTLAGFFDGTVLYHSGKITFLRSSTVKSSTFAYIASQTISGFSPSQGAYVYVQGMSVRCVAR